MRAEDSLLRSRVHHGDPPPWAKPQSVAGTKRRVLHDSSSSVLQSFDPHAGDLYGETGVYHHATPKAPNAGQCLSLNSLESAKGNSAFIAAEPRRHGGSPRIYSGGGALSRAS